MKFQPVHSSFMPIFILLPLLLAGSLFLFLTLSMQQPAFAQAERCFASLGNSTEYASVDAQAVRAAIAAAPVDGVVKIAGDCRGVINENGTTQLALLTKAVTLRGGYTPTDWTNSQPSVNPTTLDALHNGRVISTSQPLTLENLIVQNGMVTNNIGGGLYVINDLWLINSQINNNQATGAAINSFGGGLAVSGAATLVGVTFLSNTASGMGGGAYVEGATTITGTTFRANRALLAYGGGLTVMNLAMITATDFLSNSAGLAAGGAALLAGRIVGSSFLGNQAGFDGGGLVASYLALVNSRFRDNRAGNNGGALWVSGSTGISTTSFINNMAQQTGGALYLSGESAASLFVFNNLFARNRAQQGDAVYLQGKRDSRLFFFQNTLANPSTNGAPQGVAVAAYTGTVSLFNTIVANYQVAVSGTAMIDEGYNLYENVTTRFYGSVNSAINSSNGASNFVDSANDDYHLLPGSDAIDRGATGSFLQSDLEGAPRPQGYAADIGAYESPVAQGRCFASADAGTTVRVSGDSTALQQAIDDATAIASPEVRVAGNCTGVNSQGSVNYVAVITRSLTLVGGYGENNWTVSDPVANPTTLDALQSGRVIIANQPLTITNLIVQNGLVHDELGGGIFTSNDLALVNSQIRNNAILTDSRFTAFGGGAYIGGTATITHTSFDNNRAGYGGGVAAAGDVTIMQTRFLSNTAQQAGGALYLFGGSTTPMRVVNTLFARNRSQDQQSDAIYLAGNDPASSLALLHNTIAQPLINGEPPAGVAIGVKAGALGITNTIIAHHSHAITNSVGMVTENYNLYDGITTLFAGTVSSGGQSRVGASSFADSANDDYHLLATSAALDVGVNAGVGIDLEGAPRPQGSGFDIGAFEWDHRLATVSIGDGSATEGDSGFTTLTLPVNLSFANALTVTVQYSTTAGSATDGVDYTGVNNGTLTFAPHVATQSIAINILGDTALEGNETFTVTLDQPSFATIGDGTGQSAIIDNEIAPTPTPTVTPPSSSRYLYLPVVKR